MEEQQTAEAPKKSGSSKMIIMAVVVVVVILVGVIGYQSLAKNSTKPQDAMIKEQTQGESTTTDTVTPAGTEEAKMTKASYKNGSYTETGNYISPGGEEQIKVTITLTDGKITDSSVVTFGATPTSKLKQADFAEHYKEQVIGKSIDEVALTKVSGSSLTPKGFNDALEKIKADAKA